MTQEQKAAAVTTIAGIFGQKALNVLMKEGEEGLAKYIEETNKSGTAQKLADARMEGTAGAMEKMSGAIETAMLAVGEAMAPAVVVIADFIATIADKFGELSPHTTKLIVIFAAVAAAIGPILVFGGMLVSAIGTIIGVFAGVTAAVAAPIAIIVALVAVFVILYMKSEAVREVVGNAFSQIAGVIGPAISEISGIITGTLIPAFMAVWPVLEVVLAVILKVFGGAVVGVITGFGLEGYRMAVDHLLRREV